MSAANAVPGSRGISPSHSRSSLSTSDAVVLSPPLRVRASASAPSSVVGVSRSPSPVGAVHRIYPSKACVDVTSRRVNVFYKDYVDSLSCDDLVNRGITVGACAGAGAIAGAAAGAPVFGIGALPGAGVGALVGLAVGSVVVTAWNEIGFSRWASNQTQESLAEFVAEANRRVEGGVVRCAITGRPVVEAFRTEDGTIAEKTALFDHIRRHGTDPVTRRRLSVRQCQPDLDIIGRSHRAVGRLVRETNLSPTCAEGARLLRIDLGNLVGKYLNQLAESMKRGVSKDQETDSLRTMQSAMNDVFNSLIGEVYRAEGHS